VCKLYVDSLLKKFNLPKESLKNEDLRLKLCIYITQNLKGKEYKFHAFNSAVYDSIKEHGITPDFKFTMQQEFDFIDQIFKRYGINIFDYQKLNGEGKVSYSKTSSVSYYYGINSPEWFSLFTGQSSSFNSINKYQKNAFIEGDYDAAKQNILNLMMEQFFFNEDINTVLGFFEKNWAVYSNKNSMLAIIPEDYNEEKVNNSINFLLSNPNYKDDIEGLLNFYLLNGNVDCQTSETISSSNIIFVNLPKYSKIIKKITGVLQVEPNSQINFSGKADPISNYNVQK